MMKRYMPIALAVILVLALAVPTAAGPFADVPENHWAYEAVKQLAAYGLVEGFPDGTFKGAEPMTRYQMAMVIARLLVSLDAQIKAEIEAAKAGLAPPPAPAPAPAPTEKIIEKETVTVEKPIVEKVIERTIVEKLKTEELDALAAKVAGVEGKVASVEGAVDAVSGKLDEVDRKADEINAKVVELDGALALLEGELSVKTLELETKAAAGDADLAEKLAAIKAELEQKIAAGDNELSAKIEAKAKELVALIDALKEEFSLELTALGIRVTALENDLALANAKIVDLEEKLGAVDEKATAIGTKLDEHIAGHEKVTISGSSEVVFEDVDIYAAFGLDDNQAWIDPNDIFDFDEDEDHSDGVYEPTSTFEHKLDLSLTAQPAEGVAVNIGVGTVKKIYGTDDETDFQLSDVSLEVTTPGILARLYAGGILLPEGVFTPYTMMKSQLEDSDGNPLYEGVIAQGAFGKFSGTTLFLKLPARDLKPDDDEVYDPSPYAYYVCAGEGKVALTDNLKLSVAYVSQYEDLQSKLIEDGDPITVEPVKDTVIGVAGSFGLAPGWTVSGEFAKNTKYVGDAEDESGTAAKVDVTGKVGALELSGNVTRVEDTFAPAFVLIDADDGILNDIKSVSIEGTLPVGKLELSGGYTVEGNADKDGDWDEWKTNIATAGAKYEMAWGAMTVTPSLDLENTLYVMVTDDDPYDDNSNVFKLAGGVAATLGPVTAGYKATSATLKVGGGVAEPYYSKGEFDLGLDYAVTPNLKLTAGYEWDRTDEKLVVEKIVGSETVADDIGDSNVSVFKVGASAELALAEATKVTGSYNYEVKTDILNDYKPYTKSILKTGMTSQLTPKASVDAKAEFYKLDRWDDATTPYEYAPLSNLIAELNYTYNIATNTTLTLGYTVVKSDANGEDTSMDYTARIITGSLKVTF